MFLMAFAALHFLLECVGCHTAARNEPPSRFEVGLGHWSDTQCYGCHEEFNRVAREGVLEGHKDRRYLSLPLSEQRRIELASTPLSLTTSPEHVVLRASGLARLDPTRLLDFLRRPVAIRRGAFDHDEMLAYPNLRSSDLPDLLIALEAAAPLSSVTAYDRLLSGWEPDLPATSDGEHIFIERCQGCHSSQAAVSGRPAAYLALFTADWLHAYANRLPPTDAAERQMPYVPITLAEAAKLRAFLGEARRRLEHEVDAAVAALDEHEVEARTRGRHLTAEERSFVWTGFLRQGKCVHCHGAVGTRAANKLFGNAYGLRRYVGEHGAMGLWRRLEIRAIEATHGIAASTVGMPMANEPLPQDVRDVIYLWAREGCPLDSGAQACATHVTSITSVTSVPSKGASYGLH